MYQQIKDLINSNYITKIDSFCEKKDCFGFPSLPHTRRGQCGQINVTCFINYLFNDNLLERIVINSCDIDRKEDIIMYKFSSCLDGKYIYFKRLCICDYKTVHKNCNNEKTLLTCDGHHVILISDNNKIDIDYDNDYIIDFTYKQMLCTPDKDDDTCCKNEFDKLPSYLFMSVTEYQEKYKQIKLWEDNITCSTKFIITMIKSGDENTIEKNITDDESFFKKYLKYKKKYLILKNKYFEN